MTTENRTTSALAGGVGANNVKAAAEFIRTSSKVLPALGLVLGSGSGDLAAVVKDATVLAYDDIPHFPVSTAPSHKGNLVLGSLFGTPAVVMQGRVHLYEGYSAQQATFPIRVMKELGVNTVVLTNAAGGIRRGQSVGDLMLIEDHIDLPGMSGLDPTRGQTTFGGPRFTSLNKAYHPGLLDAAEAAAQKTEIEISRGVYAYLVGPSFETPAEIRFLRTLGADAVGMSTVPEVITARQADMRVLAISAITNIAIDQTGVEAITTSQEVSENMVAIVPRLIQLFGKLIPDLQGLSDA